MADLYLRSTGGSDADNGTTWDLAKALMAGIDGVDAAGDRVFVRSDHSENTGAISWLFAGTVASPTIIIGVSDANEPATTPATGALFNTTTSAARTIGGSVIMSHLNIGASAGGSSSTLNLGHTASATSIYQRYENCTLRLGGSGAAGRINVGNTTTVSSKRVVFRDCVVQFGGTSQYLSVRSCSFSWKGGSLAGSQPPALLEAGVPNSAAGCTAIIENVDFSSAAAGVNICNNVQGGADVMFRYCLLPASWSGSIVSTTIEPGGRVRLNNCQISGGAKVRLRDQQAGGLVSDETTLIRTGGAQDEGTGISFKMVTNANLEWPTGILISPEIHYHNTTTGSAVTLKVAILHDSVTNLTNRDIWMEAEVRATSSSQYGTNYSSRCDILTAAADHAASAQTWTTTGMTNPNDQDLSVTFTPQIAGDIVVRVYMADPSNTVYVCPKAFV